MAEGSFEQAVEEAKMAIRLNPRDVQAVHLLGEAHLRQKDVTQAKKLYQAIAEQLPHAPLAHFQLGRIDRQDKNEQGAIDHFEEDLQQNPNFTQALAEIVNIRVNRSEAKHAREQVQQHIEAVPDNPLLYSHLGSLWMQADQPDKAEQAFKQSLQSNDQLLDSYMSLSRSLPSDQSVG